MSKTKHEVVSEFRCAEILQAARKVFAKRGFNQATVDDIAAAAGVSKGTLYLYFRSKRDIYFEALRRDVLALHEETNRQVASCNTIAGKIRAFIATRVKYLEANRDFFKIYYSEFANFFVPLAPAPKGFRELYLRQAKMLESILQQAVNEDAIRKVCPQSTALRIYDMTLGLIAQRLLGWSKLEVEEDIESLFELVWKGIGENSTGPDCRDPSLDSPTGARPATTPSHRKELGPLALSRPHGRDAGRGPSSFRSREAGMVHGKPRQLHRSSDSN